MLSLVKFKRLLLISVAGESLEYIKQPTDHDVSVLSQQQLIPTGVMPPK
jgi:hypothetical protein